MMSVRMSKPWLYPLFALVLFACAQGTTQPNGGGDGEGGDSWGGPGSSSSASGSSSSGAGGAPVATTCDMKSADCTACASCSRGTADGLCVSQYDACLADFDCVDFATCLQNCASGDTVCYSDCESFYPAGIPPFDTYVLCVACTDCYVNCDGATSCK